MTKQKNHLSPASLMTVGIVAGHADGIRGDHLLSLKPEGTGILASMSGKGYIRKTFIDPNGKQSDPANILWLITTKGLEAVTDPANKLNPANAHSTPPQRPLVLEAANDPVHTDPDSLGRQVVNLEYELGTTKAALAMATRVLVDVCESFNLEY